MIQCSNAFVLLSKKLFEKKLTIFLLNSNHKITKTHYQNKITKNNKFYQLSPRAISLALEEDGRARHIWAMPTHKYTKK